MKTAINMTHAIQILNENRYDMSLIKYHELRLKGDPTYIAWLFSYPTNIKGFGRGMTIQQKIELRGFEEILKTEPINKKPL